MTVAGHFSTMSMADLIQWGRTAQRTGLLKVADGSGKEIRVVFRDGRIVFSATNDKRERWAAYLVHHGLCTQADIETAIRSAEAGGVMLASILVRERRITAPQAISTLTEKTIEDLCDVFLWPDGTFAFEAGDPGLKAALTINLDPIQVMVEGVRRAELWTRMNAYIHSSSYFERTDDPLDENATWENLRMAREVAARLDETINVGELVEQLPFSRYQVYRAVDELLAKKLIRRCDVTLMVDREKRIQRKVTEALAAAQAGRWTDAIETLQGLVNANPGRADLVEQLLTLTRGFEQAVYAHNFAKEDVPVVTVGMDALVGLNIGPSEVFLLSRIDGKLTVREILRISPISESDGLRAFKRLLTAKVIDFPRRKVAAADAVRVG